MPTATPPTPLETLVAALVAERGQVIAREVIVELAGRFGLRIPDAGEVERAIGLAESWETCATAARREGAAVRRQAGEDASTIATVRAEVRLLEKLAESFQLERDEARGERDALFAIGWQAVVYYNDAEASANEAHDRLDSLDLKLNVAERALASETFRANAAAEQVEALKLSASRTTEAGLEWQTRALAAEKALPVAPIVDTAPAIPSSSTVAAVFGTPAVEPRYEPMTIRLARRMPPAPSMTIGSTSSSTASSPAASASSTPASSVPTVHLRVLQVGQLQHLDDSFHCPPFVSTVRAGTCLDRQKLASAEPLAGSARRAREVRLSRLTFTKCRGCSTGASVAGQLDKVVAVVAAE